MSPSRWFAAGSALAVAGVLFWFAALGSDAGEPKAGVKTDYKAREMKASPAVKNALAEYRAHIAKNKLPFEVGYTHAMDHDHKHLTGTRAPANLGQLSAQHTVVAAKLLNADQQARAEFVKMHPKFELPGEALRLSINLFGTHFDWRDKHKVTPVRDQSACGSCWAFGALGAYEGSYLIRNIVSPTAYTSLNVSEQHILTCSKAGTCSGGWHAGVFDYLINHGACSESALPYTHKDGPCNLKLPGSYRAVAWDYVKHDARFIPSHADMKAALKTHGPLVVAFDVTGPFFGYTKGVFKDYTTPADAKKVKINHDMTLVGWDDAKHAWIVKNSWGTGWGMDGYCYIDYDTNCIGYGAAWVHAKSNFYILPPKYFEILPNIKPHPDPLPIKLKPFDLIKPEIKIQPSKSVLFQEEEAEPVRPRSDCANSTPPSFLAEPSDPAIVERSRSRER